MQSLLQTALDAADLASEVLLDYFGRENLEAEAKQSNDFVTAADKASEQAILELIRQRHPQHSILSEEAGWSGVADAEYVWVVDPLDGTTNFLHRLPVWGVSIACLRNGEPVVGVVAEPVTGKIFSAAKGQGAYCQRGHCQREHCQSGNGRSSNRQSSGGQKEAISVSGLNGIDGAFVATGFPFKAKDALPLYLDIFESVFRRARAVRRTGAAVLDLAYTAAGTYDGFFEFKLSPWDLAAGAILIQEAGGKVSNLDGGADFLNSGSVLAGTPDTWRELVEIVAKFGGEQKLASSLATDSSLVGSAAGH